MPVPAPRFDDGRFDDEGHRAAIARLADQCVLCGLCLPHCPTYALDRQESESPRGRISLIHALAERRIDPASMDFGHLDHCLGCRRCEAVCPAKVEYGELLLGGRDLQQRGGFAHRGIRDRLASSLLAHPRWLHHLLGLARPLWRWLPRRLRNTLPRPPSRQRLVSGRANTADPPSRGTVGLFLGCIARRYSAPAQQSAIDLLRRCGWSPMLPEDQGCCGAQAAHAGDGDRAKRMAEANRRAFAPVQCVVTLDSGCHEALSDALGARTIDLLDLLDGDPALERLGGKDTPECVAVFAPCTQRNVVHSDAALRRLLARLPGVETTWIDAGCCGAAGDHMLRFPERAAMLREPLLQQLIDSGCERLLIANTGCRLHLQVGIEQRGLDIRVQHPVEFIAQRLLRETP